MKILPPRRHQTGALRFFTMAFTILFVVSCKQGPKEDTIEMEPVHDMDQIHQNISLDVHRVKVLEVLPAEKYVYLRVEEGETAYWMATGKTEVKEGGFYQYNEALIKKDFESKSLGRTFETLYLVTRLAPAGEGTELGKADLTQALKNPDAKVGDAVPVPENPESLPTVQLSTLLQEKAAFEGQWIQVAGSCTKVNPAIMGRNWVHIQAPDGAKVVVTTQEDVAPGQELRFAARVALDRDFGSGYSYPLLLEQGQLVE